jgi:hypothetical protein
MHTPHRSPLACRPRFDLPEALEHDPRAGSLATGVRDHVLAMVERERIPPPTLRQPVALPLKAPASVVFSDLLSWFHRHHDMIPDGVL